MGILDRIKKAFDRGGVDIDIDAPDTFRWQDGQMPVGVRLANESDEPRLVTALELKLAEDQLHAHRGDESPSERARRRRRADRSAVTYRHGEPITLDPGAVVPLVIDFPLSLSGAVEAAGGGEETPGWVEAASGVMNVLKEATRDEQWYRLEVRPVVEGFSAAKVASRRIRNLRTGEFGGRMWTSRFG